ncbi:hypothetical protein ES703_17835 [subsurface metagenome]
MDEQSETVLIASVGTTPDPIVKAIVEAKNEGPLTVFLVYGRAFPGQEPDPFSVAQIVSQKASELGIKVRVFELDDPEDLDDSFQLFHKVMAEALNLGASRILVDFTGGTKVMGASMVHVALSQPWATDIVFEYVGGPRDEYGRVKEMEVQRAPQTAVQELASKVLECIRQEEYTRALYFSESLPEKGKTGFLKRATLALWHWDNFHYEEAWPLLNGCAPQAKVLIDNGEYSSLADTVIRLDRAAGRIKLALVALRQLSAGQDLSLTQEAVEGHLYMLGDVIQNTRRRVRSSPTDSVLRSYRSVEVATQIGLIRLSVNPWRPDWSKLPQDKLSSYLKTLRAQSLPKNLSLWNGFALLELLTSPFESEIKEDLEDVMSLRNLSYLEHGYSRVSIEAAEKTLHKMEQVVIAIASRVGIEKDPLQYAEELRLRG